MHPDILGWAAAALMVATFSCREARLLRPLAVATNVTFIGYGLAASLMPVLALHLLLLPINLWRWAQAVALSRWGAQRLADQFGRWVCVVALSAMPLMAGCGGGGESGGADDAAGVAPSVPPAAGSPPSAPAAATIGPAGGTARAGDGAEVTVPAGALSGDVPVEVRADATGAPAVPRGVAFWGPVYAFTPHGTSFAMPVTVTVPFDPARVPAGVQPVLYKADSTGPAAGVWYPLADAVVVGPAMRATIDAISHLVVGPPAAELTGLERFWIYEKMNTGGPSEFIGPRRSGWAEVYDRYDYLGQGSGHISGNATGGSYDAWASSPLSAGPGGTSPEGTWTHFTQVQTFLKRLPGASLDFTITSAHAEARDFDPRPLFCRRIGVCRQLHAEVQIEVTGSVVETGEVIFHRQGRFYVHGVHGAWQHGAFSSSEVRLWDDEDFTVDRDVNRNGLDNQVNMFLRLRVAEQKIDVPLKDVLVGQRVTLRSVVRVMGVDRRQTETKAWAHLRDPQNVGGGVIVRHQGLLPVGGPSAETPAPLPAPAPACAVADAQAGTLQFETAQMVAEEHSAPAAWVVVTRTGGTKGRVGATVATRGGTATPGEDYTAVATYVGFADGEGGRRVVAVPVHPDSAPESDETIELELTDPRGCAALGATNRATLTVLDDDSVVPPATYRVGGTVSGLAGAGLVLEDRAQLADLPIAADGSFEFAATYGSGAAYDVRVKTPPTAPAQICTVARGSGVVGAANVSDIEVSCSTPPPPSGLDPSFGALGKMVDGLPGGARAIARQSTGHILATNGASLVRYHADGRLDTGFNGGAGKVDNLLTGSGAEVADLAVGSDDRIVVAGRVLQPGKSPPFYQMAAARLLPDGARDTSFGSGGMATFRLAGVGENATRVLVQPDGRVVLVGQATPLNGPSGQANNDIAVVRLTADGTLDSSFGTSGATLADAFARDFAFAAALQPDGRIFVAGRTSPDNAQPEDTLFTRLTAAGAIEPGFGRNPAYSALTDEAVDVALQPDGKLVLLIAGRGTHAEVLLARLNPDGSADTTFGSNGLVRSDIGPHDDMPRSVALQADGRIVVAAQVSNALPVPPSFAVLRFDTSGVPDATFGTGGVLRVPFFGGNDSANDLLVQPDGRIVVAGSWRSGLSAGIALVRLIP